MQPPPAPSPVVQQQQPGGAVVTPLQTPPAALATPQPVAAPQLPQPQSVFSSPQGAAVKPLQLPGATPMVPGQVIASPPLQSPIGAQASPQQALTFSVQQPASTSGNLFDSLSASELIKSMAQGRGVTSTSTVTSGKPSTSHDPSPFPSQGVTPGQSSTFFKEAPQLAQLSPQKPALPLQPVMVPSTQTMKLAEESSLMRAALQSTPVVSLQRLRPVQANPMSLEDLGRAAGGTITIQKLDPVGQPLSPVVSAALQPALPHTSSCIPLLKRAGTERELRDQLLVGSPKKGQPVLTPVVEKLTHAKMMQLLTSKPITATSNTGS